MEANKPTHKEIARQYAERKSRMIKKIYALGYRMGWDASMEHNLHLAAPARVRARIDTFLASERSPFPNRTLDSLTGSELPTLVTVFERLFTHYLSLKK